MSSRRRRGSTRPVNIFPAHLKTPVSLTSDRTGAVLSARPCGRKAFRPRTALLHSAKSPRRICILRAGIPRAAEIITRYSVARTLIYCVGRDGREVTVSGETHPA